MSALLKPQFAFSFDDYLSWEGSQEERFEYVGGLVYSMSGGTQAHNLVTGNAFAALHRLYGGHCRIYAQGYKVRVKMAANDVRAYYPDAFETCKADSSKALFKESPCIVVEVLSPSSERSDRTEKMAAYKSLESLATYVLIDTEDASVQVYKKSCGWQEELVLGLNGSITVECGADSTEPAPQTLTMAEIYRHVFN